MTVSNEQKPASVLSSVMLPKSIVIKSPDKKHYLSYEEGYPDTSFGTVSTQDQQQVFNPLAKISVEPAEVNSNLVRLRFTHTGKYWAKGDPGTPYELNIVAISEPPEKDKSKAVSEPPEKDKSKAISDPPEKDKSKFLWNTLFEPIVEVPISGYCSLRHVQSRMYVCIKSDFSVLGLDPNEISTKEYDRKLEFVDWDTLVILPKHVRFRGDNGKFLQVVGENDNQFSSEDGSNPASAYEITMVPDGHVRIKSTHNGKFWRVDPKWIKADSSSDSIDTQFWPVKISNDTIALRSAAGNRQFCKRLEPNWFSDTDETISSFSHLKVEELVLERTNYNVCYRMEYARIKGKTPKMLGIGSAINDSEKEAKLTMNVSFENSYSSTFTNSLSLAYGVKTEIEAGIPLLVDGKFEVSLQATGTEEWNRTTTSTTTTQGAYEVVVPPRTSVQVSVLATQGTYDVPFSYTRRDKLVRDGSFVVSEQTDGIYTGVNYYDFHFVKHVIKSDGDTAATPKIIPLKLKI